MASSAAENLGAEKLVGAEGIAEAAGIFEALGDPVRRGILEVLATGEHSAGAIVDAIRARTPMSQPAVSQHLKVLRGAGLVSVRSEGTRRIYAVEPEGVAAARAWLARLVHPIERFVQPLDALATEIARGKRSGRQRESDPEAERGEHVAPPRAVRD